jgi:hypothetical protein
VSRLLYEVSQVSSLAVVCRLDWPPWILNWPSCQKKSSLKPKDQSRSPAHHPQLFKGQVIMYSPRSCNDHNVDHVKNPIL